MKKVLSLGLLCLLLFVLLTGSGDYKVTAAGETKTDTVTTASTVNNAEAFLKATSDKGTWIIVTLNDIKCDKEIVVAGEFRDKNDPTKAIYRKIAPYTQDADHKVLDRFTITAPRMIVRSQNTKIQGGTFVGDVYVEANGFAIQDATVKGNVYFAKEEYKASFNMANKGVVTGTIAIKSAVDVVTTASTVNNAEAFLKATSDKGTWIIVTLNDIKCDKEIVVAGEFRDKNDPTKAIYRKIAPYTQDAKKQVLDRFTITAPRMIVRSQNTKIQGGTFVGDVYVEANGFVIQDATVKGNVYFAKEEYKASFNMANKGVVTGTIEIKSAVDVVTTASTVNNAEAFLKATSEKGTWIIVTLNDIKCDKEIVVAGEFRDKNDPTKAIYRKIAPYTQDAAHKVLDRFTITAPKMTIRSQNTKLQGGTFVGDVYVEANGFTIQDATVKGNVYFAKEEYKASFNMANKGVVTGTIAVK